MSAERRSRYLRVVRPGSGAGSDTAATPPLPVEPPLTPPLWLDPPHDPPVVAAGAGPRPDGALPSPGGRPGAVGAHEAGSPADASAGASPNAADPASGRAGRGFPGSVFQGSVFHGSVFQGAGFPGSVFQRAGFPSSVFHRAGLPGSVFPGRGAPGSEALASDMRASDGLGADPFGTGLPDEDPVGAALRSRLHQAVGEVRPAADSLAQLRRAVPQRRALRRRAYGGAAVAASLALLGLTALHSLGPDADTSAETGPAGQLLPGAHASTGGSGQGGPVADSSAPGLPSTGSIYPSHSSRPGGTLLLPLPSGGVTAVAASPPHGPPPSGAVAECTRGQLGNGAAGIAPADSTGIVYGSFAVTNVSRTSCKISSPGAIAVLSPVGTSTTRFSVAPHTAGDPAVSLPAPDPTHPAVALGPGQSYVVDFAFVPAVCASNSTAGPSGTPTAAPATAGTASTGATGGAAGTAGAAADGTAGGSPGSPTSSPGTPGGTAGSGGTTGTGNPSPGSPSVQLATVPASGGAAAASTTLQGACAGTIYRTDPLAAPR